MKTRKKEEVPRPTGKRYNSVDELVAESTPEVQAEYNRLKLERPTEVLRSLVADIEAMKAKQPEHWFGGFESWYEDHDATGIVYIQWPNLAILLEEAKQVLKEQNEN